MNPSHTTLITGGSGGIGLDSHNHYDHLDRGTVRALAAQPGGPPLFVVPLGVDLWMRDEGIGNVRRMDWWDRIVLPGPAGEVVVHFVPAQHWSSRTPWDRDAALWGGFVVEGAAGENAYRMLFAGDTGYSPDFGAWRATRRRGRARRAARWPGRRWRRRGRRSAPSRRPPRGRRRCAETPAPGPCGRARPRRSGPAPRRRRSPGSQSGRARRCLARAAAGAPRARSGTGPAASRRRAPPPARSWRSGPCGRRGRGGSRRPRPTARRPASPRRAARARRRAPTAGAPAPASVASRRPRGAAARASSRGRRRPQAAAGSGRSARALAW